MNAVPARVLLIDDDAGVRFGVRDFLETRGYQVDEAEDCRAGEQAFRAGAPDLAVIDFALPDGDALTLLPALKAIDASTALVVLTGHGSIDLAVRAVLAGAEHFLTKPVDLHALDVILRRLLEQQRNSKLRLATRGRGQCQQISPFIGTSPAIRRLQAQAERVLGAGSPILIQGETGSGKGVLASWLHAHGPRADENFVDLNCAGLTREFLETELFGHAKGAFTGAAAVKTGLFEVAHRGTLFLDEIADMPADVQPRLLKVLEDKRFRRLGEVNERSVDVKLIAASAQPLGTLVAQGQFRKDLYFRLDSLPLELPPLRERREDIVPLAEHLLMRLAREGRGVGASLSDAACRALEQHDWPGNVRELRNCLERAILLSDGPVLGPGDLRMGRASGQAPAPSASNGADLQLTLAEMERRHILQVLDAESGQVEAAAARLGLPRSTLYQKLKQYRGGAR
jgi:DNA-binding NtrC family response regulator